MDDVAQAALWEDAERRRRNLSVARAGRRARARAHTVPGGWVRQQTGAPVTCDRQSGSLWKSVVKNLPLFVFRMLSPVSPPAPRGFWTKVRSTWGATFCLHATLAVFVVVGRCASHNVGQRERAASGSMRNKMWELGTWYFDVWWCFSGLIYN